MRIKTFDPVPRDEESKAKINIALELPEDIARQLRSSWGDMPRRALEAVALEGYRSGALSRGQAGRILGLNFWETEAFLKEKQAYLPYAGSELAQDGANLDSALGAGSSFPAPLRSTTSP